MLVYKRWFYSELMQLIVTVSREEEQATQICSIYSINLLGLAIRPQEQSLQGFTFNKVKNILDL